MVRVIRLEGKRCRNPLKTGLVTARTMEFASLGKLEVPVAIP